MLCKPDAENATHKFFRKHLTFAHCVEKLASKTGYTPQIMLHLLLARLLANSIVPIVLGQLQIIIRFHIGELLPKGRLYHINFFTCT